MESSCLDTHHVKHHVLNIPHSDKSHSTTPSEFHITHPLSFHTEPSAARLPLVHTPHTDLLRGAADRYSQHLQVELSERNSL